MHFLSTLVLPTNLSNQKEFRKTLISLFSPILVNGEHEKEGCIVIRHFDKANEGLIRKEMIICNYSSMQIFLIFIDRQPTTILGTTEFGVGRRPKPLAAKRGSL